MNFFKLMKAMFQAAPRRNPVECFAAIRSGKALLVDVREEKEWAQGIADSARRLALSDLTGARAQWNAFLPTVKDREVLVYCAAGGRSAIAAKILCGEGFKAVNVGALHEWESAGWKVAPPPAGK